MKSVIHISINEGVLILMLYRSKRRVWIYILLYIWKKLRNKVVLKIYLGVAKSCIQMNKAIFYWGYGV